MKAKKTESQDARSLPSGRLLVRPSDEPRFVVVRRASIGDLWIVEDGWTRDSAAAGPFQPDEVLRAVRLANTLVPEGCELGPWQAGIGLFGASRLPAHPNEWTRVEPAHLPSTISCYLGSEISGAEDDTCCAPPRDLPRVRWNHVNVAEAAPLRERVATRHPSLRLTVDGALLSPWNGHPKDSLVLAETRDLDGVFVVIDLPHPTFIA